MKLTTKKTRRNQARQEADKKKEQLIEAFAKSSGQFELKPGGFSAGPPALTDHAVRIAESLTEMQEQFLSQGAEEHFISACVVELGKTSKQYTDYNDYLLIDDFLDIENKGKRGVNRNYDITEKKIELIAKYINDKNTIVFTKKEYTDLQNDLIDLLHDSAQRLARDPDKTDEIIEKYTSLQEAIQKMDSFHTSEALANSLRLAFEYDQQGLDRLFRNRGKEIDRLMRATFAIEDRERASFLAKACLERFNEGGFWEGEHRSRDLREFFDFVEDVETVRNDVREPITRKKGGSDIPTRPKGPNVAQMYEEYIDCDNAYGKPEFQGMDKESATEICRVRVVGEYYGAPSGGGSDKPKPVTGTIYLQLTSAKFTDDASKTAALNDFKNQWKEKYSAVLASSLKPGQGADYPVNESTKTIALLVGPFATTGGAEAFKKEAGAKIPQDASVIDRK